MRRGSLQYDTYVVLDRNPFAFLEILNSYREGVLPHEPTHISPEVWIEELYWFGMHKAKIPTLDT